MVCDRCGEAFLLSNDVKYMTPDEFADYITAKSEQVEKELRERWS
jgi:hypothetical protein